MSGSNRPPAAFPRASLRQVVVGAGARYGRIHSNHHPDPLGYGKTPSRFSDPRRRVVQHRFGVLYLGASLKVCFLEAFLRDQRNGFIGDYLIDERELDIRQYAQIEVLRPMTLVNLQGDALSVMGVPSDVARGSHHGLARAWSVAFREHPSAPDGIIYDSRLNGETNLAIYDRAIHKLGVVGTTPLRHATGLAAVLNDLSIAIV